MGRPFGAFVFAIAAHKVADAVRGAARSPPASPRKRRARASGVTLGKGHSGACGAGVVNRMGKSPLPLLVKVP